MPDWRAELEARLSGLTLDPARAAEIVEELSQHLDLRYAELRRNGLSDVDARHLSLDDLADNDRLRQELRSLRQGAVPEPFVPGSRYGGLATNLWQDVRYATRILRKQRGVAVAAVLTLALAIGATVATFTIVNGLILRPAPWLRPGELYRIERVDLATGETEMHWSQPRFATLRHVMADEVPDMASFAIRTVTIRTTSGDPGIRAGAEFVSPEYVHVTGVGPTRGRAWAASPTAEAATTVLLSARLADTVFAGSDPLGQVLRVNGVALTVVGTMPREFFGLSGRGDLWIPVAEAPRIWGVPDALSEYEWVFSIAMRIPGSWPVAARMGVRNHLAQALGFNGQALTDGSGASAGRPSPILRLASLSDALMEPGVRHLFWVLLGAALCVLLLACANVANFSRAQLATRYSELAIRSALGASRGRRAASLLVEAALIGGLGGSLGWVFAVAAKQVLWLWKPTNGSAIAQPFAAAGPPATDAWVVAFAIGATLLAIALISVWPLVEVRRPLGGQRVLTDATERTTSRSAHRVLGALSMLQVGFAFVVAMGAVLFVVSFRALTALDHGFAADRVLTFRLDLPLTRYDAPRAVVLYDSLLADLRHLPGVVDADLTNELPLDASGASTASVIDPRLPDGDGGPGTGLAYHSVGSAYFRTIGAAMSGAVLDLRRVDATTVPVVVTRSMAQRYWPGRNPIGQSIDQLLLVGLAGAWRRGHVVGVAPDIAYGRPGDPPVAGVYVDYHDDPPAKASLVVKSSVDPISLVAATRAVLTRLDANLVLYDVRSMADRVADASSATRFGTLVLSAYAGVALVIAVIGVSAVVAFSVAQRRVEIAIRLALGATPGRILRSVLRTAAGVTSVGLTIGLFGSAASARVLRSHLFGVAPSDPTLAGALLVAFALVTLVASLPSALIAMRTDPASTIKRG